jgi:hypothetical protein
VCVSVEGGLVDVEATDLNDCFYRRPVTTESKDRLQKTWKHIMEKSNRSLPDKPSVIEHDA